MTPFQYGGFYDVPRCIYLRHRGQAYLMESYFDEELDEYPEAYTVYAVPDDYMFLSSNLSPADRIEVGTIPIQDVSFDETRRHALDPTCIDNLLRNRDKSANGATK